MKTTIKYPTMTEKEFLVKLGTKWFGKKRTKKIMKSKLKQLSQTWN